MTFLFFLRCISKKWKNWLKRKTAGLRYIFAHFEKKRQNVKFATRVTSSDTRYWSGACLQPKSHDQRNLSKNRATIWTPQSYIFSFSFYFRVTMWILVPSFARCLEKTQLNLLKWRTNFFSLSGFLHYLPYSSRNQSSNSVIGRKESR